MTLDLGMLVQAAIGSLFANGLWAGMAKDDCPLPYGVYTYVNSPTNYYQGQVAGAHGVRASLQHAQVQVDIYGNNSAEIAPLADSVEDAMAAQLMDGSPTSFTSMQLSRETLPVTDPTVYPRRVMLQFSVWFRPRG